ATPVASPQQPASIHRLAAQEYDTVNSDDFEPAVPRRGQSRTLPMPSILQPPLRSVILSVCCLLSFGTLQAQQETTKFKAATLTLVADTTAVAAGKPFSAGVRFQLDPEWDIYWQFVGDIGLATSVDWELPPGFTAGPLQWPIPVAHLA